VVEAIDPFKMAFISISNRSNVFHSLHMICMFIWEAIDPFKMASTSISNCAANPYMLWMCIWLYFTAAPVGQAFGSYI